jgi:hypothetical protein
LVLSYFPPLTQKYFEKSKNTLKIEYDKLYQFCQYPELSSGTSSKSDWSADKVASIRSLVKEIKNLNHEKDENHEKRKEFKAKFRVFRLFRG